MMYCITILTAKLSSEPCILSQTYNATLLLFDYFYVHAHALGKLFHLIISSFSQASNPSLVLTIHIKLAKKQCILLMKGSEKN